MLEKPAKEQLSSLFFTSVKSFITLFPGHRCHFPNCCRGLSSRQHPPSPLSQLFDICFLRVTVGWSFRKPNSFRLTASKHCLKDEIYFLNKFISLLHCFLFHCNIGYIVQICKYLQTNGCNKMLIKISMPNLCLIAEVWLANFNQPFIASISL
jgi:hypothetical protein